jgi:hypothetical protein
MRRAKTCRGPSVARGFLGNEQKTLSSDDRAEQAPDCKGLPAALFNERTAIMMTKTQKRRLQKQKQQQRMADVLLLVLLPLAGLAITAAFIRF